jgi:hypothetical protein
MHDIKKTILERDLNPYHSFLSAFFAGMAELGLVNQGSMNIVSRRAAEYLYSYLEAKEILPDMGRVPGDTKVEVVKNLVLYVNRLLSLMGGYDLKLNEQGLAVLIIEADKCRICPKGVGGAEVKGTICPIPSFLEGLINHIAGEKLVQLESTGIEKVDNLCRAYYQIL